MQSLSLLISLNIDSFMAIKHSMTTFIYKAGFATGLVATVTTRNNIYGYVHFLTFDPIPIEIVLISSLMSFPAACFKEICPFGFCFPSVNINASFFTSGLAPP